jgi:hypothetical protein
MAGLTYVRTLLDRLANMWGGKRDDFTCGDCSMNERCGLPPSEDCVARAAQISSGRRRRRPLPDLDSPY